MSGGLQLGIVICECGGRLEPQLDLDSLEQWAGAQPEVTSTCRLRFGCSPAGLAAIRSHIAEHRLDALLVAGCTPRTMRSRLQTACQQAGLQSDRLELVDIREGCAWVHQNSVEVATAKAADLIGMGMAALRLREPHQPSRAELIASVLVIGGGLAGMTAALTLAEEGIPVKLVERAACLGGRRGDGADGPLANIARAAAKHPQIDLLLEKEITKVGGGIGRYRVRVASAFNGKEQPLEFEVGAIIIATGARAHHPPGADRLAFMLGIPQDVEGGFPAVRRRLRPGKSVDSGIYVCGAAHRPTDALQTEFQAVRAAFSALRHLGAGSVSSRAPAAVVMPERCSGCASCLAACPFGAITMHPRSGLLDVAQVDSLLCSACGNCAVACPCKAIALPEAGEAAIFAQIEAALITPSPDSRPRVLVFGCEWSGQLAADLAGARRISCPSGIRPIRLECSARFDPAFALWAFLHGADGVLLAACPPGRCHHGQGNRHAQRRVAGLREQLGTAGFDARRLRLEWVQPDDPTGYTEKLWHFWELMEKIATRRPRIA